MLLRKNLQLLSNGLSDKIIFNVVSRGSWADLNGPVVLFSSSQARRDPVKSKTNCKTEIEKNRGFSKNGGPGLRDFLGKASSGRRSGKIFPEIPPYIDPQTLRGDGSKVYLDIYGCQMNVSDAEVILSILESQGYSRTSDPKEADIWLIVTCSIREGAETKIWKKLRYIQAAGRRGQINKGDGSRSRPVVGVLGCMAERVREGFFDKSNLVDIIAGPDSYRDLPRLLASVRYSGEAAMNVLLSQEETYSSINPVRLDANSVTAFVSIQRGCDNMCSYCIVPFTRGRERSRPIKTILDEVQQLVDSGVKEITLLGQNVNSYRDTREESLKAFPPATSLSASVNHNFKTVYKPRVGGVRFVDLLDHVSRVDPDVRIRFTSPHPKDFPLEVLELINERDNICKSIHLPAQSGSNRILEGMNRGYTVDAYMELVNKIRELIPGVALTSDFIAGFCGETEEDFLATMELIKAVGYHKCFIFPFSTREKTSAYRKLIDDVPSDVKSNRHLKLKEVFREGVLQLHRNYIGQTLKVLITGLSKRSQSDYQGTADFGTKVIFPVPGNSLGELGPSTADNGHVDKTALTGGSFVDEINGGLVSVPRPGQTVLVRITDASSEVLKGHCVDQPL